MARKFQMLFVLVVMLALSRQQQLAQQQSRPPAVEEPPEEDETLLNRRGEYEFNPLQSQKEVKIGNFYMKKGSWRAAAGRFLEATLWDPTNADAFYRMGEAYEKLGDKKGYTQAWEKFLELAPEDKRAAALKKRLNEK